MAVYPLGALATSRRPRYLFQWESADETLLARTGQLGTYARNDTQSAGVIDSNGVYGPALPNQPRFISVDTDGDAVRDAVAIRLEAAATNLAFQSEALATSPWVATTLSVTNGFTTFDGMSWSRVSSAASGSLKQSIGTLAGGNGVYVLSVHVRQDAGVAGTFSISIQETAGTVRGRATVTIAANGAVTVTPVTGSVLVEPPTANQGYRVHCISTACTAANAHTIFLSNFAGAGGTATSYLLAGGQLELGHAATSYIKTTTGTAGRLVDSLTFPVLAPPQTSTLYLKFVEGGTILTGSTTGLIGIGASTNLALFLLNGGSGNYQAILRGGSDVNVTLAAAPSYGQLCELRLVLSIDAFNNATIQLGQSIAGGTESLTAVSSSLALSSPAAYHDTTLTLNSRVNSDGYSAIQSVRWAAGVQAMTAMRRTA